MYVDVASASNSCQVKNRTLTSPGVKPCTELLTRGGVWRYRANKLNQHFSPAERFATGIRNAEGIAVDTTGRGIYTTQHGRDQLAENWPALYKPEQGATMPSEVLVKLKKGGDFGWPECYFDPIQQKLVLAPEYGGDGGKKIGECANKTPAVATFPAHWGPNALLIYGGTQFPQRYRQGAFIAFHGSWNRSPFPQGGYNLVYQTLNQGSAESRCEIFADGFAGTEKSPENASHRPSGLAMSPEGDLYVSDDASGRIYKITYLGGPGADQPPTFVPCPSASAGAGAIGVAGPTAATADGESLPVAKGATPDMVAVGNRIYHGQVGGATCVGCHGAEGKGTPLGPNLVDGDWLWGDGSLEAITKTIVEGVSKPKQYRNAMPPLGGAQLTKEQVAAVAAYVWGASHRNAADAISQATPRSQIGIPGASEVPKPVTKPFRATAFNIGSP
jgi:mono/diheme cytochrome c family protein